MSFEIEHTAINKAIFSGSNPGEGSFQAEITPDKKDWCIVMYPTKGERIERYCSTWSTNIYDLTKVCEILRNNGFTIAGEK